MHLILKYTILLNHVLSKLTFHGCVNCSNCSMLATSMAGMVSASFVMVHAHTSKGASHDAHCNIVDSIAPSDSNPAVTQ